jgi:membrane fusion protein, multidrug efflux system
LRCSNGREAQATRTEASQGRSDDAAQQSSMPKKAMRSVLRRWVQDALLLLAPFVLIAGGVWCIDDIPMMSIGDPDEAYIDEEMIGISTDVPGIVKEVDVKEYQYVEVGQVMYSLDDLPFRLTLERAEARVATVRDDLNQLKANYQYMQILVKRAKYDVDQYATELRHEESLSNEHVGSQAFLATTRQNLQIAREKLTSLDHELAAIADELGGDPDIPSKQHPRYLDALAQRDEAARRLAHTVVKASFAGIVANVSSVVPGKYLQASEPVLYLIVADHALVDSRP